MDRVDQVGTSTGLKHAAAAGAAALLAIALLLGRPGTASARDLALVIGNDAYRSVARLNTAVADAQAMGDALERLGFTVRRAVDVDQRAMSRTLAQFDGDLAPGDQAFFFFAGHGLEISGANYLLPTDVPAAEMNQSALVRDASFAVEQIIDGIRQRGTRVAILVLDACRDNPFAASGTRSAAITGGLARVDAPEGVFVLMSAGAKQEALDRLSDRDPDRDSVFTRTFLGELAKPGRTLVQVAKATQVRVRDLAATVGYEQTPAYYDQVIGDVVLTPRPHAGPGETGGARETVDAPREGPAPPDATAQQRLTAVRPADRPQVATLPNAAPNLPEASQSGGGARLSVGGRAPIASFMRSNAGWTVTVSLPEPALALSYRLGSAGPFRPTGLSDTLDPHTGERQPNLSFSMPSNAPATSVEIRYTTADGGSVGPFAIAFDPEVALFDMEKKILEMMPDKWVEFHDIGGLNIYFTTLVVYRCAISQVRYGLNDGQPLARYDLPGCNPKDPFTIPSAAGLLMRVPATTRSLTLQITWRDGTQSPVQTISRD